MKITNLYGKQIYLIYEGEIFGTVCGALFNESCNKIKALKVFDHDDNEYVLPISNIKSMDDVVVVNNKSKILDIDICETKTPMFKNVVCENGSCHGTICDCEIDKLGNILSFITNDQKEINPKNIHLRKQFVYCCQKKNIYWEFKAKASQKF